MFPLILVLVAAAVLAAAGFYFSRRHVAFARIEVTHIYLTAEGTMLDVRFRVKRAGRLAASPEAIYLLGPDGERVGQVVSMPKIGRLATRHAKRGTGGYLLLRNTSGVTRGDTVSVVIGRNRQEGIVVEG